MKRAPKGSVASLKNRSMQPVSTLSIMQEQGWPAWRKVTGYCRHSRAETAVGWCKSLIGARKRARSLVNQQGEAALTIEVLNQMIQTRKPVPVRVA
jgi:hypothetical protein